MGGRYTNVSKAQCFGNTAFALRAILGNRSAHDATDVNGKWNWPEATLLAKLAWEDTVHPQWPDAIVPGQLAHIEFMSMLCVPYQGRCKRFCVYQTCALALEKLI